MYCTFDNCSFYLLDVCEKRMNESSWPSMVMYGSSPLSRQKRVLRKVGKEEEKICFEH